MARLYGHCPPGTLGCLGRLPARMLRGHSYITLLDLLDEPRAAKVLRHTERITANTIAVLRRLDPTLRDPRFTSFLAVPLSVDAIEYLIAAVERFSPSTDHSQILKSLVRVTGPSSLEAWFGRTMSHAPLPPPPWAGNSALRPLVSAVDLRSASRRSKTVSQTGSVR